MRWTQCFIAYMGILYLSVGHASENA
jgi:hypothetical protein